MESAADGGVDVDRGGAGGGQGQFAWADHDGIADAHGEYDDGDEDDEGDRGGGGDDDDGEDGEDGGGDDEPGDDGRRPDMRGAHTNRFGDGTWQSM